MERKPETRRAPPPAGLAPNAFHQVGDVAGETLVQLGLLRIGVTPLLLPRNPALLLLTGECPHVGGDYPIPSELSSSGQLWEGHVEVAARPHLPALAGAEFATHTSDAVRREGQGRLGHESQGAARSGVCPSSPRPRCASRLQTDDASRVPDHTEGGDSFIWGQRASSTWPTPVAVRRVRKNHSLIADSSACNWRLSLRVVHNTARIQRDSDIRHREFWAGVTFARDGGAAPAGPSLNMIPPMGGADRGSRSSRKTVDPDRGDRTSYPIAPASTRGDQV